MTFSYGPVPLMPLPGDPERLAGDAVTFAKVGALLRDTATLLLQLAADDGQEGDAIIAVRDRVSGAASAIDGAEPRYSETAAALGDYAVVLADAKTRADAAAALVEREADTLATLESRRSELSARRTFQPIGAAPETREDLDRDIREVDAVLGPLRDEVEAARESHARAVDDRDTAAQHAIDRIDAILDQGRDSLWDDLTQGMDDLLGSLGAALEYLWNTVVPIALELLAVAQLLAVALLALALLPLLLPTLLIGLAALALANGGDWNAVIDDLIAAGLIVVPVIAPALLLILRREALTRTPALTAVTAPGGELRLPPVDAYGDPSVTPYADAFTENGLVDDAGGADHTQVSVIQVFDEHGDPVGWRVVLPSTQDWQLRGDAGATNDLGSNLALMLTPEQQAAYQRMVVDAMREAGIGPDDPVMLVGWSQGGILAGRLATDPSTPGDVQAMVVAGSPIDAMDIPDDVSVVSVQSGADPVHRLDGQAPPSTPNWVTVVPSTPHEHGSGAYADTASTYIDGVRVGDDGAVPTGEVDAATQQVVDAQSPFFADYGDGYAVEHVYVGAE